jgi:hypothetical protein
MEESSEPKINSVIRLNVGGCKYTTTGSTLSKFPGFLRSLVENYASGTMSSTKDEKGRLFIDRSGKPFYYILEFLRSESLDIPEKEKFAVLREAEFYQLEELTGALKIQIANDSEPKPDRHYDLTTDVLRVNVNGKKFYLRTSPLNQFGADTVYHRGCCYFRQLREYLETGKISSDIIFDDEGRIFIDSYPALFPRILTYLHKNEMSAPRELHKILQQELKYFFGPEVDYNIRIVEGMSRNDLWNQNFLLKGQEFASEI